MDTRRLQALAISESGLIFEPVSGYIFTSSTTGILIINALKEGKGVHEIKTIVSDAFDVDEKTVEKDIFDFISQLINCGLIKETV